MHGNNVTAVTAFITLKSLMHATLNSSMRTFKETCCNPPPRILMKCSSPLPKISTLR